MSDLARQILDSLPITVYTVDLSGRLTFLNRSWERFARDNGAPQLCDESAVIGTNIWDAITDPQIGAQMRHAMDTLREGLESSISWEFPCNSPTEIRVFLMQLSALCTGGVLTGFAFSTVDITPSHRSREILIDTGMALARTISTERVLHEVAQQLQRTISCETVAIALAPEDSQQLVLVHSVGFSGEGPADVSALAGGWAEAITRGASVTRVGDDTVEIVAPIVSGTSVRGAVTLSMNRSLAPHYLEEIQRVLTTVALEAAAAIERARLIQRLDHKRRLEAIGEVSAGVAHELRNPLFGISSAAQLLRFRAKEDPVVEKNVGRILREVDRLNAMVTSLLEYGRPRPVELHAGDPEAVWDDVLENQKERLCGKHLTIERVRAPARASIDPSQLSQVFINVLLNAVDAAPEASTLRLASSGSPNTGWKCMLWNDGPPLSAEVLPHVFDMFFSTKTAGTGIGLALCLRIIEDHRGTITLDNAASGGNMLTINLPPLA